MRRLASWDGSRVATKCIRQRNWPYRDELAYTISGRTSLSQHGTENVRYLPIADIPG
jgi:hypothetical protein